MSERKRSRFFKQDDGSALVRRLLTEQAWSLRHQYAIAFVLMGIGAGGTALGAYLIGNVINAAYVDKNLPAIISLAIVTAIIFIVKALATYGHGVMLARIGNHIIAMNQRRMFDALITQSIGFFSERHSSEFMARLTTGANAASVVINLLVTAIGRDLLSLIGLVAVMFYQDPAMSAFTFFVAPPAFILLRKMIRRIYSISRNQFHGGARILETLQETVQGIRIVKAYTMEDVMRARLEKNVTELEHESNKWARVAHRASPLMEGLGGIAIAGALVYGGFRVLQTGATPGQFFSFLAAFMLAYEPAKRLARLNIELNSGLVGVRVLFEIIDAPPTEPADTNKPPLKITQARIDFQDVLFGYRPQEVTIRGMTFTVEPGKMTALVGPSGGGKSTVFNLMMRFYEPNAGTIRIDGQNIAETSRHSLREQVAYVGQDVFLFHGTIRENIAIGKPGASEDEIVAAAKAAHAHEFISAFPAGYDTQVGERGMQLSGGERQRVAIARALIRNAQIILLDEATAALDSQSERLVQDAMTVLCEGRTTIAIAHRLHTITHADRILVVESGAIVESGRHEELLRKNGRYAAFYRLQIQHDQEPPAPISIASA
ncbi:ABC transporter ATP-binding protein [Rhodoplanes sp. Z2-YC6860]|uniref:ABC transporter ATP-binding protein n=1 Tax=Rhodoplanes sp. Z2-YC6860 TaxID=674703 RepID=UPI00078B390C|nr:ABC transporter ATP-binding protein [Rhodoplanes sp. Z2-YC6860]AMN43495.1 lipid A export ATP-binding/permease protein MsbA [Rhodoplanes sp. Z2-YC6860]